MDRKRRKHLLGQLALAAQVACESHAKRDKQREALERVLHLVLTLLPSKRMNDERRQSLANVLEDAAYGTPPTLVIDKEFGNHLYISGHFDVGELSKRIVWSNAAEAATVEDSND